MRYVATYTNKITRPIKALHLTHARKIAQGIGKSNKWKLLTVEAL